MAADGESRLRHPALSLKPESRAASASFGQLASSLWRDPQFALAVLLPLGAWLVLYLVLSPQPRTHEPGFWLNQIILIPLIEELIFRGWLQGRLLRLEKCRVTWFGISCANALVASLFAIAHVFTHPPLWALLVIFPALVFGYFRERHSSVIPAIVLHIYYNGGYFFLFA